MRRDVLFEVDAPRAEIERALDAVFEGPAVDGVWQADTPTAITGSTLSAAIDDSDGGTTVALAVEAPFEVPFFQWAIGPLVLTQLERRLEHTQARIEAARHSAPEPPAPRPVLMLPSVPFTPAQATSLATYAFVVTIATFGVALLGQNAGPIGETFGASDTQLANVISFSRAGVLVGLFVSAIADRRGRRSLALWSLGGIAIANAVAAVAPTLWLLAGTQTLTRGFVNAAAVIAGIAAVEEAPDGARAFAVTMTSIAGGLGFSIAVITFAFTDLADGVWRVGFALSGLTIFLLPRIARVLPEPERFHRVAAQANVARGRVSDLFTKRYRSRIILASIIVFCLSVFQSPSSQFMNKYLSDDRNYSSGTIFLFRAASGVIPGLLGMIIASRLTESVGRKPVAMVGLLFGTIATQGFFLLSGMEMWAIGMISLVAVASGSIAMGTLDSELFPTRVRGTAGAILLVCGVSGSVVGLQIAGRLSDAWGSLGDAIAVTGIATLFAAAFLIPFLPESASRTLDELSPDDEPPPNLPHNAL